MTILRVFPNRTSYTPTDDMVAIGYPGLLRPDEVHISVSFTWDKPKAENMLMAWKQFYPDVSIGGPAYGSQGAFVPGRYVKHGVTFTSRGCNRSCPWLLLQDGGVQDVWTQQGRKAHDFGEVAMRNDKPKLLDLFCCAGGAGMGYFRAGFDVFGVDNDPKPLRHYPFPWLLGDAMDVMARLIAGERLEWSDGSVLGLEDFDAIHASPPCQAYSMMQNIFKSRAKHPDMVADARQLLEASHLPWVIENVYQAPLQATLMLCGTMFGLRIIRHRFFELPWLPLNLCQPCDHSDVYDPWHKDGVQQRQKLAVAMGIDWNMTRAEVRQAIPPAYTFFIGQQLMRVPSQESR